MSTVRLWTEAEANPRVKAVFDDIRATRKSDFVNNVWRALANQPDTLERIWSGLKDVMVKPGALDPVVGSPTGSPSRPGWRSTMAARRWWRRPSTAMSRWMPWISRLRRAKSMPCSARTGRASPPSASSWPAYIRSGGGGEILCHGEPLRAEAPVEALRRGIAMVYQETSLVPSMTVAQNLFLDHERAFNHLRGITIAAQQFLQSLNFTVDSPASARPSARWSRSPARCG